MTSIPLVSPNASPGASPVVAKLFERVLHEPNFAGAVLDNLREAIEYNVASFDAMRRVEKLCGTDLQNLGAALSGCATTAIEADRLRNDTLLQLLFSLLTSTSTAAAASNSTREK